MALKDSTVKDLDDLHRKARSARAKLEPSWYLCLAFYEGKQWTAWDGRQIYQPQLAKNRITIVDNRIQPCVRTEIARMTKKRPIFTVTPNTPDEMDVNAAKLGESVMKYLWKHLNMQELTGKALHWSRICGAGFLKFYWDRTVGESVEVLVNSQDNQPLTHPQTGAPLKPGQVPMLPGMVVKEIRQGEIKVEARSPFQIFPDPLADTFEECEWLIEESIKSAEYVKRRYGVDIEPDSPANPGLVEARMGSAFLPGSGSYKGVKVREYWCKPCATHPQGRRAVWTATSGEKGKPGQLLFEDNEPFDPMPYVMLSGIPIPGRLWPTSIAEQLRGPQTELNKVKSQIAENRNRVGNPTILASKQAVQDPEKFSGSTTIPGGIYYYDDTGSPNAVPAFLAAPALPQYVIDEIVRIEESIQEISGQHEVTSAQVPPGVTAASAINLLQEADDTRLGPSMTDYEYQLGKGGQKILKMAARFYTDQRAIRLAGDNGALEVLDFRGSMLRENTHVEVQAGSAFPQSKAAKQAAMTDILRMRAQSGDPIQGQEFAQFMEDYDIGGAEHLVQQYVVDELQVNGENVKLAQGQPLQINSFDNDEAHIAGHTDFQKSARYTQLGPQIGQLFEAHVAEHRQRLQQAQAQQMQQQMQMQGTPPPGQQQAQAAQEMQGQAQQQQAQAGQAQQQLELAADQHGQRQGFSQAQAEQAQRHAEEAHSQKITHQQQLHEARLRQLAQQQTGGNNRG